MGWIFPIHPTQTQDIIPPIPGKNVWAQPPHPPHHQQPHTGLGRDAALTEDDQAEREDSTDAPWPPHGESCIPVALEDVLLLNVKELQCCTFLFLSSFCFSFLNDIFFYLYLDWWYLVVSPFFSFMYSNFFHNFHSVVFFSTTLGIGVHPDCHVNWQ